MDKKVILTREEIERIIPHRDPILLIDEVAEMVSGESIVARFRVCPDRDIFRGHFPGEPVFPGVYTIECMAQASCVLILSLEEYRGKLPLFLGVDKTSFKKRIPPGAELTIYSKVMKHNVEKAVIACSAEVYMGEDLAASGEVALAIR